MSQLCATGVSGAECTGVPRLTRLIRRISDQAFEPDMFDPPVRRLGKARWRESEGEATAPHGDDPSCCPSHQSAVAPATEAFMNPVLGTPAASREPISLFGSEPIFPVADVVATVRYYSSVLGFPEEWLWGDPPGFGGVRWGKIGVMFSRQQAPDAVVGGQWHAFLVDGTDRLYDLHKRNGATIWSPLEAKPWGMREYTVRDLNGHFLRFGQPARDRSATSGREPATAVTIVERLPTVEEYLVLANDARSAARAASERAARVLAGARSGVVALDGDCVVGAGLVVGDGVTFAYLRDIVVLTDWQGRGVGSRIVEGLLALIYRTAPEDMLVTLFTGQDRASFYERFGFGGPEAGLYGMTLRIGKLT
jgi:GNAT superfamily N-acetyltransferase